MVTVIFEINAAMTIFMFCGSLPLSSVSVPSGLNLDFDALRGKV